MDLSLGLPENTSCFAVFLMSGPLADDSCLFVPSQHKARAVLFPQPVHSDDGRGSFEISFECKNKFPSWSINEDGFPITLGVTRLHTS